MNKKGFTLVEVIAAVALIAILLVLTSTSFVKKYNESKKEAIIIQEEQLVQSGDMVVKDYCKDPLSEGYQLQCDNYYQSYEDSNNNLIIEDNTYTKYICVKDLKKIGYYSEELRYSGVDCSGVVIYKIDYDTDLQKDSYSVIRCGEDYVTEIENAEEYITKFSECFDAIEGETPPEVVNEYTLVVNFTELTPSGMKVAETYTRKHQKGQSISINVPTYATAANAFSPFKHGSSTNAGNFNLNTSRTTLTGTMPEGNVTINIVYAVSTYMLTVNYKEFNNVQGNITYPPKQYTLYFGETVTIPYEEKPNFKVISPANFNFQMQQEDAEIDVIYQQQEFTLSYDSNGGSSCSSRNVGYAKAFGTLCTPTRTGYTFNGWKDTSGNTITASTINNNYKNISLTAQWTANKYAIIYNCNGGTPTSSYTSEHTYDVAKNLANNQCEKLGSVFTGWSGSNGNSYSNNQSVINLVSSNNGSITLNAQWTPLTYYIAFAPNGGSGTMGKMTLRYGQVVNLTNNTFTRTGHRFDGWTGSDGKSYANQASVSNLTTAHESTVTMTARWTKCGAGTYLANNTCTNCAAGTYSNGGVNSCTPCAAGTYNNSTGQSACVTCAAGTYNTTTGNTTCKSCDVGYYCTGGTNKVACAAGKYSAGSASSCSTCTAGYYCPGASNRIVCPTGHTSSAGASECTKINYTITIARNNTSYGTVNSSSLSIPYGTTYTVSGNTLTFSNGVSVTASVTNVTGYTTTFSGWSSTSGTITGNTSITANFNRTINYYTVAINRNNTSYGTVNSSSLSIPYGTTYSVSGNTLTFSNGVSVTASVTNVTGYITTFSSWSSTSGTITGNVTITANFTRSASSVALLGSSGIGGSYYDCGSKNTSISVGSSSITVNYAGGNGSTSEFYWYGVNVTGYTKMSVYVNVSGMSDRAYATFYVGNKSFGAYEGGRTYTISISGSGNQRIGFDTFEVDHMSVSGWTLLP